MSLKIYHCPKSNFFYGHNFQEEIKVGIFVCSSITSIRFNSVGCLRTNTLALIMSAPHTEKKTSCCALAHTGPSGMCPRWSVEPPTPRRSRIILGNFPTNMTVITWGPRHASTLHNCIYEDFTLFT